jgi:hypothetical protein
MAAVVTYCRDHCGPDAVLPTALIVMAGHSRPKDGVLSHGYVPAIHVFIRASPKDVDARHKAGHDGRAMRA